jgi:VCBS repeat-containing protein
MIRAIRPNAVAQDDAALITGWNIAPNVAYTITLLPGASACGVLLYDEDGSTLIASGSALAGTSQPCTLTPQTGQTISVMDADLSWHLLLTTAGTESQRTIRIGPMVDLPDEIHPVYGDDDMSAARATAAINEGAHYIDGITVSCPLGLGAGLGDVVSVPVDGEQVIGQVESISWVGTPDGATETAVIRRHVAIAPEAFVEPTPPMVADDTGAATHLTGTSGNVLSNDDTGLTITAVNGLSSMVGTAVDGDNGGSFTVNADGSWTFSPDGDFALLEGTETANTSISYHASDGVMESMGILTVTVSHENIGPVAVDDGPFIVFVGSTESGNVLLNDTDEEGDQLSISKVSGLALNVGAAVTGSNGGTFTIDSSGAWSFDPGIDFDTLSGEASATTSITYHVTDGYLEDEGTLSIEVRPVVGISLVGAETSGYVAANQTYQVSVPTGVQAGDVIVVCAALTSAAGSNEVVNITSSGFTTVVANKYGGSPKAVLSVAWKVADGTETNVSVYAGATSYYRSASTVYVFRNVDTASPIDSDVVTTTSAGQTPRALQLSAGALGLTVVACSASSASPSEPTAPSETENLVTQTGYASSNTGLGLFCATADGPSEPDVLGLFQWSDYGTVSGWLGATIVLRPASVTSSGVYLVGTSQYFMGTGTVTTHTFDLPSGLQEGDLVVVVTGQVYTSDKAPGVLTSGYTEVAELYANDSVDANVSVNYKFMGATPDTEIQVVGNTANPYPAGTVVQVFRGVDTTTPMDVTPVTATGVNTGIPTPPAITPVTSGARVVSLFGTAVYYTDSVSNPPNPPSGFLQPSGGITGSTYKFQAGIASAPWDGIGEVAPEAWSNVCDSANDSWGAVTLALRPAA